MKILLQILILLTFSICKGQVVIDGVNENDIQEIILNCRDLNVKKFKITEKENYNGRKSGRKLVFYYSFDNDSTLTHIFKFKGEKEKFSYVIRNNQFIYMPKESEIQSQQTNYYSIQYDSANVTSNKTFLVNKGDTALYSYRSTTTDTLKRLIESISWNCGETNYCHKWEYSYNTDTITTTYFKYGKGSWYVESRSSLTAKTVTDVSSDKSRVVTSGNSNGIWYNPQGNSSYNDNYKTIRTITFDNGHIIKSIITEENVYNLLSKNSSSIRRVKILTVQRLDK